MSIERWMRFFTAIYHNPWGRLLLLTLYDLVILIGLVVMYGKGNLSAPDFIYQGF